MKKCSLFFVIPVLFLLTGCKKENPEILPTTANLSGVWQLNDISRNGSSFFADKDYSNNFIMFYSGNSFSYRWGAKGNEVFSYGYFSLNGKTITATILNLGYAKMTIDVEELSDNRIIMKGEDPAGEVTTTYEKVTEPTTYCISNQTSDELDFGSFYWENGPLDFTEHGKIAAGTLSTGIVYSKRSNIVLVVSTSDYFYFAVYPQKLTAGVRNTILFADTTSVYIQEKSLDLSKYALKSASLVKKITLKEALTRNKQY